MNWYEKVGKVIDLALRCEIHAFMLVFIGAGLYLHGAKEMGSGAFTAGLAIFRGGK